MNEGESVLPGFSELQLRRSLDTAAGKVDYYSLRALEEAGLVDLARLPFSIRVLLENMLRHRDGSVASDDDVRALAGWRPEAVPDRE
ncbi:MAG: hypothetical protein DIU84_03535, partial [Bacillota bacterium]